MLRLWLLFSCCLFTLGHALNCSVIQDNGRTTYILSDLPQVSAGSWDYTWANSTNHVIANNKQAIVGLVLKNTNTTLDTSEYIEGIVFTGFIVSTGERDIARCQITDTENARSWINTGSTHYPFLTAAIAVMVVCVLLALLLVFLLYKFRDKIPSCWSPSCPSAGCMYSAVKTTAHDLEVVTV